MIKINDHIVLTDNTIFRALENYELIGQKVTLKNWEVFDPNETYKISKICENGFDITNKINDTIFNVKLFADFELVNDIISASNNSEDFKLKLTDIKRIFDENLECYESDTNNYYLKEFYQKF